MLIFSVYQLWNLENYPMQASGTKMFESAWQYSTDYELMNLWPQNHKNKDIPCS